MLMQSTFISVNAIALFLSPTISFVLYFALVLIFWMFALVRQTIIMSILSSVSWATLAGAVWIAGDPEDSLTSGLGLLAILMCFIMLVITVYYSAEYLRQQAEEKQRRLAEEII